MGSRPTKKGITNEKPRPGGQGCPEFVLAGFCELL
jgi:hypothetical protein